MESYHLFSECCLCHALSPPTLVRLPLYMVLPLHLTLRLPGQGVSTGSVTLELVRCIGISRAAHDAIKEVAFDGLHLVPPLGTQPCVLVMRAAQLHEERSCPGPEAA